MKLELRKKSIPELNKMLKDLEFQQLKASSVWSRNLVDKKKALGAFAKGTASQGEKTSLIKDLRRLKAKILTEINSRK